MSTQSKRQMETAICDHMNLLTQRHFSARLSRIPRSISVKDIISMMLAVRKFSVSMVEEENLGKIN